MNWDIIGSDNGLMPIRRQAIAWTNNGLVCLLSIGLLGTNFNEILIKKHFTQEKAFENVICQIGDHFVQGRWVNMRMLSKGV